MKKRKTVKKKLASKGRAKKKIVRKGKASGTKKTSARRKTTRQRIKLPADEPPQKLSRGAEISALDFLEKVWPDKPSQGVREAFTQLKTSLQGKKSKKSSTPTLKVAKSDAWLHNQIGLSHFNPLDLIRRILMSQDMLFLSRQITYHISATSDLPPIWGDPDHISQAFSHLTEHLVKRADRDSRIDITLTEFSLRHGPGVKISFENSDSMLDDMDSQSFLDGLLRGSIDEQSGISLHDCRQAILHQRGQMWADLPKPHHPIYHVLLPASEEAARQPYSAQQTFKYDISITNYANVRKRFGIKKSASLVTQIEHYIRSLVRYPIDMVMALGNKGIITTIYETQKGAANSVASRISQRLGREEFRIGKRPVELMFKYQLSQLAPQENGGAETETGRSN